MDINNINIKNVVNHLLGYKCNQCNESVGFRKSKVTNNILVDEALELIQIHEASRKSSGKTRTRPIALRTKGLEINVLPTASRNDVSTMLQNARPTDTSVSQKINQHISNLIKNVPADAPISSTPTSSHVGVGVGSTTVRPKPTEIPTLPARTADLPSLISKDIGMTRGPKWMKVGDLPGYHQDQIRAIGRSVFGHFTKEQLANVHVLANLHGTNHPHSDMDLNTIGGWIKKNAETLPPQEMDFEKSIPGYKVNVQHHRSKNVRFMTAQDDFGKYIYAWPENLSKPNT
jgi:hypothetical protein